MDDRVDPYIAEKTIAKRNRPRFDCLSCGYDLRGLVVGEDCPECGIIAMSIVGVFWIVVWWP